MRLRSPLVSGCSRRSAMAVTTARAAAQGQGMIEQQAQVCSERLRPSPLRNHYSCGNRFERRRKVEAVLITLLHALLSLGPELKQQLGERAVAS